MEDTLKHSFDGAERIGVVGSPSSTHSLVIDILGTAVDKKLVGSLSVFQYSQDGADHYALGQITEIRLRNVWSEDPTMRGLIRQKGRVDPITERQDTHNATMLVSSVFGMTSNGFEPSMLGTVPATGTPIKLMNENILKDLLSEYKDEVFYLGRAYGSRILLPMWFKHFGSDGGGAGEAYHIGVFGKTGSGKSVLSKMVMLGYARNPQMTIFVLDPQGEFSRLKNESQVADILINKLRKEVKVYDLHTLVLSGNDLFIRILILSGFLDRLAIFSDDNKDRASDQLDLILRGKVPTLEGLGPVKPWDFHKRETFKMVYGALQQPDVLSSIYTGEEYQERIKSKLLTLGFEFLYEHWSSVARLFAYDGKQEAVEIKKLTKSVTAEAKGQVIIINLSEAHVPEKIFWNDDVRMIVISEFLKSVSAEAQAVYKQDKTLNTLVILDEAHRLAPRERQENPAFEEVKNTLKDAVRTTRKYGLGWMFVSQTLSSLDREIINQLRISIFGFGLAYGVELQGLREIIGGNDEAISLYQLFKDPQSTPKQKEYSFMTIGPISPLSFSGVPLFFQATQYPSDFVRSNAQSLA